MPNDFDRGFTQELQNTCPCCGYETLLSRSIHDVCPICWWEDAGQDNPSGDETGPNRYSLNQARFNFLTHGLAEPERTNLHKRQDSTSDYKQKRFFRIKPGRRIEELNESNQVIYERQVEFPSSSPRRAQPQRLKTSNW